ncbi:hypothetical protein [Ferrimonas sediminicola]|uniref:hypothetical protein n=1 Tax=Ferrimonas sediminicola TaxID=2569538 RepID=UPI00145CBA97|nr:hypothetical protein [Ferrimonas sediminicola]
MADNLSEDTIRDLASDAGKELLAVLLALFVDERVHRQAQDEQTSLLGHSHRDGGQRGG